MQPSIFNVRVPLEDRDEVFLMNTFTDAQLIVSRDVVGPAGSPRRASASPPNAEERDAPRTLAENGFIVESRDADRQQHRELLQRVSREARTSSASRC